MATITTDSAPPAGPISAVQGFVSDVVSTVTAPVDALNLAVAQATLEVLKFLPKMPAARLYTDLVFQFGHSHPHPPSFGIPIPSVGPVLASGCMSVLINGLPSARNGDLGLAVWCGGYFPIFEIITGSSHVFMGGARAARQVMDVTLHCLPDPLGGKWGIGKLDIAMAVFGVGMSALNTVAAVEGAIVAQEVASESQGTADAEAAAAAAAAAGVGAGVAAAQLAADAAAMAMGLLMGKDPGVGFPFGMITMGSPNVLVGGFPMPGWMTILKGLGKLLKPLIRKIQLKLPKGSRLRNSMCFATGCPVEVVTGRMFTPLQNDFIIDGRIPINFERIYDTSSINYEGSLGWGWTHPYEQHLWESTQYNCLILRNEENRQVRFDKLSIGQRSFQPLERIWLERTAEAEYTITDCKTGLYYKFGQVAGEDFRSEKTALRLLEISDRNENRIRLKYEGTLLTEIHNESETYVTLHYHNFGNRSRLTEIRQHLKNGQNISLIKYGYNSDGELISDTNRTYSSCTYFYENHLMTRRSNRDGFNFHYEYEGNGIDARCIHTWGDDGILERWLTYSPKAKMTRVKNGDGGETIYHYNDLDLVTKVFDAEGGLTQYEYGDGGELLKETDEILNSRTYTYDEQLNCTGVIQEDGTTVNIEFNDFSEPLTITDEAGGQWRREYDERGNILAKIDPLGARREYEYNRYGDVIISRDTLGNETTIEWNGSGQIRSLTNPRGGRTLFNYNERTFISEVTEENTGLKTNYQYDDAGRINRIAEINAKRETISVRRYEYDEKDRVTLRIDALGNRTIYKYAGYDTLAETVDAHGFKRRFEYDRENRLKKIINERNEDYLFEYDFVDRLIETKGFDNARQIFKYDKAGNLVYKKDALQRETYLRYDAMSRVTSRLRSDGTSVKYAYDECGRMVTADNEKSVINITFDAAWQIVSEEQNGQIVKYEYDTEGRRIARHFKGKTSDSNTVEYDYDADHNLSAVKIGERKISFERDLTGRLTTLQLANGLQEKFEYDPNGRLSGQKLSVGGGGRDIVKRGYQWDALGNLVGISDSLRGTRRYVYDAVERINKVERMISGESVQLPDEPLVSPETKSGLPSDKRIWQADNRAGKDFGQVREIEEFQYDGADNLIARNSNVRGSRKFSYGRGDKLEQQEKTQYIYDAVGNLIQKRLADGVWTSYEYDGDDRLIAVSTETHGKIEFKYDAFGRRIAKITNQGKTEFFWDGDVLLAEEKDSQLVTEYVHDAFVPLVKIKGTEIETYHTDYLGTPKEITNLQGEIIWQGNYDEYGKVREVISKTEQNIRFQGQYEDQETGLFYNRFRYYDADGCRYINQDPIGLEGGMSLYSYVHNPNDFLDPFGLGKTKKNGAGTARWSRKVKKDGTPFKKPGPKAKGTGDHNAKIDEIINRELTKPGVKHIGGGSKTEIIIDTPGGVKPERRMDASFEAPDGSKYHINVGRTLADGKTGVIREVHALNDVRAQGHSITFEGYGKDSDYRSRPKKKQKTGDC